MKDINGVISSVYFNDNLDRPTQVIAATNDSAVKQQKTFSYDDTNRIVTVTGDLRSFNDNLLKSQTLYDGLGRTTETRSYEGSTDYIASKQVPFDVQQETGSGLWRAIVQVSNPYRPGLGEQPVWTTTMNDALGRGISVTSPDNAKVKTTYLANTTTVEDQAGKQRKSVSDGAGRLIAVYEAPNDTTNFNFQTNYKYDGLNNLRLVTQDAQKRYFLYDSLSRLIRVRNPELGVHSSLNLSSDALTENNSQWSIGYTYDNNANLLTKTDARATTTTFTYDALNRATQRSYSSGSAVATPTVTYTYDASGVANSKGRLTSTSSSVSAYNLTGYDSLGRVIGSQQVTGGQTYSMSYAYDLAGNMTSQTYPTGRVVTQNFDEAGRLASIGGQAAGGTPKTYANSFGYAAHGALERMRLGNGRWEHTNFNDRLQPTEIGLGSSSSDSSLLKLSYDYGTTSNNGNVLRQVITVPTIGSATGLTATQHYQYDQLNRLTGAQEVGGGTSTTWQSSGTLWQQKFTYDRYGNRSVDTANTTSSMVGPNPDISASTNRIVPRPSPVEYYRYDDAGNLDREKNGETLTYDAENKLMQYQGGATQTGGADYSYDGEGRRVKKARAVETLIFVYNIAGQLVAEYTTSTPQNNGTSYLTSDMLGTPRVNTKTDGSVRARHDYLPFGEELYAGTGNRTGNQGQGYDQALSPADTTRQKFTGKERDVETQLDYFVERYYSSHIGRFISTDKPFADQESVDPQSWNLYAYVRNNPAKYIDKLGDKITYASPELEAISDAMRVESSSYDDALKGYEGDGAPDLLVQFGDAGLDDNGKNTVDGATTVFSVGESYDTTNEPWIIIPARVKSATITIDKRIQKDKSRTEDVLAHEVGHANDARTNAKRYVDNSNKSKAEKGKTPHDKRPNEVEANRFRDTVNAERKATQKKRKEEEKQKKKDDEERKKN